VRVPAFEIPRASAEGWAGPGVGEVTVSADDRTAYLLREDGSARARLRWDSTRVDLEGGEPTSWWVNGSVACSDERSTQPWDGSGGAVCQFGWGGAMPDRWVGYGTVTRDGLKYLDAGGAERDLLPADDHRTDLPGGGICA